MDSKITKAARIPDLSLCLRVVCRLAYEPRQALARRVPPAEGAPPCRRRDRAVSEAPSPPRSVLPPKLKAPKRASALCAGWVAAVVTTATAYWNVNSSMTSGGVNARLNTATWSIAPL